jgi:cephalosporin hydroxylase
MSWSDIPGLMNFEDIYDMAAARAKPGDVLVEVGIYNGRSVAYLAEKTAGRNVIYGIDNFSMADEAETRRNLAPYPHVIVVNASSQDAADSILLLGFRPTFVFLDALHDYESVKADIAAWLPLVRPGGVIAGHDYSPTDWPGVVQAVQERFGPLEPAGVKRYCWWVEV